MKPSIPTRGSMLPAWTERLIAWLLIALGVWVLPLGFFIGIGASSHPTWLKLLLGGAGILAGSGILRHRAFGAWLGIALLLTQLVGVAMSGFSYQAVISIGFWFRFPVAGQTAA